MYTCPRAVENKAGDGKGTGVMEGVGSDKLILQYPLCVKYKDQGDNSSPCAEDGPVRRCVHPRRGGEPRYLPPDHRGAARRQEGRGGRPALAGSVQIFFIH